MIVRKIALFFLSQSVEINLFFLQETIRCCCQHIYCAQFFFAIDKPTPRGLVFCSRVFVLKVCLYISGNERPWDYTSPPPPFTLIVYFHTPLSLSGIRAIIAVTPAPPSPVPPTLYRATLTTIFLRSTPWQYVHPKVWSSTSTSRACVLAESTGTLIN